MSALKMSKFSFLKFCVAFLTILTAVAFYTSPDPSKAISQTSDELLSTSYASTTDTNENTVDTQNGLKAYYRFDNTSRTKDYGLEFDNKDDFVEVPHDQNLNQVFGGSLNFTLSSWIYVKEWENHAAAIHKAKSGWWSGSTASLWIQNDGLTAVMGSNEGGNNNGSYIRIAHKPSLNEWHHMAATANNTHLKLYVDGELKGSKQITDYIKANLTANTKPVTIGRRTSGHNESLNGSISEVRAFERNLSEKEIQNLYRKRNMPVNGLVLHQRFNEYPNCDLTSEERCLIDDSGNGHDGTPYNFSSGLNSGSGWTDFTPFDFARVKDHSGENNSLSLQGRSLKFDGSDDSVNAGKLENTSFSKEVTTTAWVKLEDRKDYRQVVSKSPNGALGSRNFTFSMRNSRNSNFLYSVNVDGSWVSISEDLDLHEWHHMAMTYNGTQLKAYKDGELVGTTDASGTLYENNASVRIGSIADPDRDNWKGNLKDTRVYNVSLSSKQINKTYHMQKTSVRPILRYNFNSGTYSCDLTLSLECIMDISGNNNRGIPQGFNNNILNNKSGWSTETPPISSAEGILNTRSITLKESQKGITKIPGSKIAEGASVTAWIKKEDSALKNGDFDEDSECINTPTYWKYPKEDSWRITSEKSGPNSNGGKSFGNNWNGEEVCGSNPSPDVWPDAYVYQDIPLENSKEVNLSAYIELGGNPDNCTDRSEGEQCVLEDDARLHMYAFDKKGNQIGEKKGLWGGELGKSSGWNFYSLAWEPPQNTSVLRIQIDGGDGNNDYIDPETGHGGNAGLYIDDVNLDVTKPAVGSHVGLGHNQFSDCEAGLKEGKWHFVASVYDGQQVREYVDDKLCRKSNYSVESSQNLLKFGEVGSIDELRFYNRNLSEQEIQRLAFQ